MLNKNEFVQCIKLLYSFLSSDILKDSILLKQMINVIEENLNSKPIIENYLNSNGNKVYIGEFGQHVVYLSNSEILYEFIIESWQKR